MSFRRAEQGEIPHLFVVSNIREIPRFTRNNNRAVFIRSQPGLLV